MSKNRSKDKHNIQTKLIHSGAQRSQNNETSEAIYLTSGYIYNSAEEAEARFKGEIDGYISRGMYPYKVHSHPRLTFLWQSQWARLICSSPFQVNDFGP